MQNENRFYPKPENRESNPKIFEARFDRKHFGNLEEPMGTRELVGRLNEWWDSICFTNGLNPRDKKIEIVGYCIVELGKNALEHAGGGQIKVIFNPDKITAVVSDNKGWEGNPNDDLLYGSPGHGLSEIKRYADEFVIETNGVKFTKVPKKRKLVGSGDTDIQHGSKITFIKNL